MQVLQQNDALIADGHILGRSPKDGTELEPVPASSEDSVAAAVDAARTAQQQWAAIAPSKRGALLKKLAPELLARAPRYAEIMASELGKSAMESYTSEILPSADQFRYWGKTAPRLLQPEARSLNPINFPKKAGILELRPRGVIGLITPWNFPLGITMRCIVPALAAGNAVVMKPSEYAPRIGAAMVELFELLGIPGLVGLVQGAGDIGETLVESNVDHVVFTGSVATGRRVAVACADRLISYSLELGGNDAALVLHDANLDRAADGIVWGAFANAGQNCAAVERVYVVESVASAFTEKVIERTKELKLGGPGKEIFDVGPLVRPAGLATVEQHVADAIDNGATLRCGGKASGEGLHYEPTVLSDANDDMAIMTAETFGPVMPIAVVKDEAEAIRRANASVYRLTTSIWTKDLRRGRRIAEQLKSGIASINNHAFTAVLPHAPWSGSGHTGGGVTNSRFAFYDMCEPHYVLIDRASAKELWWFPHNAALEQVARNMAKLLGKGGGKLGALIELVKGFLGRWKS